MTVAAVLPRADGVPVTRGLERSAAVAVFALAAVLRVADAGRTPLDPFYDAAVRSMGASWHNLFVGAFDPSATVAIDKPPLDLWLQVASTRLFGFGPVALLAPAALAGTCAVIALYDLLRTLAGPRAALVGALALAVLPMEVVTSRSDTMDAAMAALTVGAFAVAARGLRRGRAGHMVAAGALLGLAFEVKLFEALIAALPLALLWWFGAPGSRGRRLAAIAGAAVACVVVGVAWLVALTVFVPAAARPWAFGSANGSAWNAAFVYDGWDRLVHPGPPGLRSTAAGRTHLPAAPGPLRLLSAQDGLGPRLGLELVAAWAALGLVAVTRGRRRLDRAGRAGLLALAAWLALGTVLFSAQGSLRPRYLEAFLPAVAGCIGAGVALAAPPWRRAVACAAIAVLLASAATSAGAIRAHAEDSGTVGALPVHRVSALSAFLRAHQGTARFELASLSVSPTAPLIVQDGRPVLLLSADGRPVVRVSTLARLAAAGQVRYALVGGRGRTPGQLQLVRWIRAHGADVSSRAGFRHGSLYALGVS